MLGENAGLFGFSTIACESTVAGGRGGSPRAYACEFRISRPAGRPAGVGLPLNGRSAGCGQQTITSDAWSLIFPPTTGPKFSRFAPGTTATVNVNLPELSVWVTAGAPPLLVWSTPTLILAAVWPTTWINVLVVIPCEAGPYADLGASDTVIETGLGVPAPHAHSKGPAISTVPRSKTAVAALGSDQRARRHSGIERLGERLKHESPWQG